MADLQHRGLVALAAPAVAALWATLEDTFHPLDLVAAAAPGLAVCAGDLAPFRTPITKVSTAQRHRLEEMRARVRGLLLLVGSLPSGFNPLDLDGSPGADYGR